MVSKTKLKRRILAIPWTRHDSWRWSFCLAALKIAVCSLLVVLKETCLQAKSLQGHISQKSFILLSGQCSKTCLKDHFFAYKSRLKRVQNQLLDNFCDWMPKSKFLILYTKLSFRCTKPDFWLTKATPKCQKLIFYRFCAPKSWFWTPKNCF